MMDADICSWAIPAPAKALSANCGYQNEMHGFLATIESSYRQQNTLRIHGTPWHGEAGLACNSHAELKAIFLIQHGSQNELVRVNPAQASAELFARSFVPWYRPEALGFSLGFMQSIVIEIPIYIFRCVPNPTPSNFWRRTVRSEVRSDSNLFRALSRALLEQGIGVKISRPRAQMFPAIADGDVVEFIRPRTRKLVT